tara:strand:+ start:387 stop:605 length:219 start_codon:yes stop_codon:yes gene_type:complete
MKKQLAEILINEYYNLFSVTLENTICKYEASKCAVLAVQEIIRALEINKWQNQKVIDFYDKVLIQIENYEFD